MEQIPQELIEDIADFLEVDPGSLNAESAIGSVEKWDSIGHLNLMVMLGGKYGFEVDAGILAETQNLAEIAKLIPNAE